MVTRTRSTSLAWSSHCTPPPVRDFNKRAGKGSSAGSRKLAAANRVQVAPPGAKNQESAINANAAEGTRLRRRLSKIFHRLMNDKGLETSLPSRRGTFGKIQSIICQSTRNQRCCLELKA